MEATQDTGAKRILVIDIGGTNLKVRCSTNDEIRKVPSGNTMTAEKMVTDIKEMTTDWEYDVVAIGYPGPVLQDKIIREPVNLGAGWMQYDFQQAFAKPVKLINDAAMQALGGYEQGRMLFLGLGTGLGTVLIIDGVVAPLELGHLRYKRGRTFEDYVGARGLRKLGKKRWREMVVEIVAELSRAMLPDYVVLGGGNAKLLKEMPPNSRLGANTNAFEGGFRLWGHNSKAG